MLQGEHSAIFSTFIKLPFVIKIFVLSIFEWPLKTGFTVVKLDQCVYEFSLNLSFQKFNLTSNYLGTKTVVVKRVDCSSKNLLLAQV